MQIAPVVAAGVHAARFLNTTTTTSGSVSVPTSSPDDGFPSQVGDFLLYGCVASSNSFPTFIETAMSQKMTLDLCAASCPARFFGVFGEDCYCGDELDPDATTKVDLDLCDIPCPGDDSQFCGGRLLQSERRRQNVPLTVLLTVYFRAIGGEDGTVTVGPTTITQTITSTTTDISTTDVTTITTTYCAKPTPAFHENTIVCYGGCCAPVAHCEECEKHRVICEGDYCHTEVCYGDEYEALVFCNGDDCSYGHTGENKKIVCYNGTCVKETCYGDEYQKNVVVKPAPVGPPAPPAPAPAPTYAPSNIIPAVVPTGIAVAGSGKALPAIGLALFGAVAGLALLL